MQLLSSGNPFVNAYIHSDWFGQGVFWFLFALSAISWTILAQKIWMFVCVSKSSKEFIALFSEKDPLGLQFSKPVKGFSLHLPRPSFEVYKAFKTKALAMMCRSTFGGERGFSLDDLDSLATTLEIAIGAQVKKFEKHLFVLSTVVTLGPFVGLIGTVWGILISFSQMQGKAMGDGMLAGLSLALATTVIGLVVAIPALIGYNYLKNALREFRSDMGDFAQLLLTSTEQHYTQGNHASEISNFS